MSYSDFMSFFLFFQAHFKLAWRSTDGVETTHRHRHEIVSYERGNISNMARSNKQVSKGLEAFGLQLAGF